MAKTDHKTEEKIREAARKVFVEKGFGSATTRDIAESADTNIALINYYFRSKEKLFQEVFLESFTRTFLPVANILNDDLPLQVKLYKFVDHMTEMLKRDPLMPLFVLSEMRSGQTQMCEIMLESKALEMNAFQGQLNEEAAKGNIRQVDGLQVESNLMAMVLFPFLSMNMIKTKYQMDEPAFNRFVDARKKIIPEMVLAYLCKD